MKSGSCFRPVPKATILRGAQCSRAAVASIFGRHSRLDVLHFACHAVYDPHDQPKSYMQLHPEVTLLGGYYRDIGRLSTDDIAAWKGTASIVILAACESAASSKEMFGTDSFPATFLRRGTRSVVAALWPVDDKAGLLFVWLFLVGLCAGRSVLYAVSLAKSALAAMTLEDAKNDLRFLAETDKIRGENIVKRLVQERIGDGSKLPFADAHYSGAIRGDWRSNVPADETCGGSGDGSGGRFDRVAQGEVLNRHHVRRRMVAEAETVWWRL